MPAVGVERFRSFGAKHMVSHTMEMMLAALSIIWDGVCERFPKVRIGFLESGGGWMASWLDRMDRHFEDKGLFNDSSLTMPPSEYFKRQTNAGFRMNRWRATSPIWWTISVHTKSCGRPTIPIQTASFQGHRNRLSKNCRTNIGTRCWPGALCSFTI